MASRIEIFAVTVPAGTPQSAPVAVAMPFADGIVDRVDARVPPGPNGRMGFQVRCSGAGVYPREDDRWIIADDERFTWDLESPPGGSLWACRAYNEGIHDHTINFYLHVREHPGAADPMSVTKAIAQPDQVAPVATDAGFPGGIA